MKRIFKLACALALLNTAPVFAEGHEGGGGAGLCTNNKCITLTEGGFRHRTSGRSELSMQALAELDYVLGLLPKHVTLGASASAIVGKENEIVFVEVVDQKKAKKFLDEYAKVLTSNGAGQLSKKIELLGFSSNGVTYLISSKFESLTTRGQALLLIHEYSLRIKKVGLEAALRLDGALLDYVNALESKGPVNAIAFLASMKGFDYVSNLESAMLATVLNKAGSVDVLKEATLTVNDKEAYLTVPYRTLLDLKKYEPSVTQYLVEGRYPVKHFSRLNYLTGFYRYLTRKGIIGETNLTEVTGKDFDDYLKTLTDPARIAAAGTCLSRYDNSFKYIPGSLDDSELNVIGCSTEPHYGDRIRERLGEVELESYLHGMKLQLPHRVGCKTSYGYYGWEFVRCFRL